MLRALDTIAHFLYCPAMAGRRIVRARWYHRIHLIPGRLLARICDRYEGRLLASSAEHDGLPESMRREIADRHRDEVVEGSGAAVAPLRLPDSYRCDHMSVSIGGAARWTAVPEFNCGCRAAPVFR
jgi:hypothetical protein